EPGVTYLGYVRQPALTEAYRLADFFVMPSLQETVCLPLLEAMSAATPVIAADRPYAREVCGEAAVFFNAYDGRDMAEKIETLAADAFLRRSLSERGCARAESFRAAKPYERMLDMAFQSVKNLVNRDQLCRN